MDNQNNQQNPSSQNSQQAPQVPVQQPVLPVSGSAKEKVSMPSLSTGEWVASSTPEVELPSEVKDAGVEVRSETPQLSQEVQAAGVKMAKEATPVVSSQGPKPLDLTTPPATITLMTKVHKSAKDAISWLVRLIKKEQDRTALEGGK